MSSDLFKKTHSIILIDYGRKMEVSFSDVREVIMNVDQSHFVGLSQKSTVNTYLLSGYISKSKSIYDLNKVLCPVLCKKYYKYRRDFEIGGITFVTLFDLDKVLVENRLADPIALTAMLAIANDMSTTIALNNKNDVLLSYPLPSQFTSSCSFLKTQYLDYITLLDVEVTRISIYKSSILLTVRTIVSTYMQ